MGYLLPLEEPEPNAADVLAVHGEPDDHSPQDAEDPADPLPVDDAPPGDESDHDVLGDDAGATGDGGDGELDGPAAPDNDHDGASCAPMASQAEVIEDSQEDPAPDADADDPSQNPQDEAMESEYDRYTVEDKKVPLHPCVTPEKENKKSIELTEEADALTEIFLQKKILELKEEALKLTLWQGERLDVLCLLGVNVFCICFLCGYFLCIPLLISFPSIIMFVPMVACQHSTQCHQLRKLEREAKFPKEVIEIPESLGLPYGQDQHDTLVLEESVVEEVAGQLSQHDKFMEKFSQSAGIGDDSEKPPVPFRQ